MKIAILDAKTLGKDVSLDEFHNLGDVSIYDVTNPNDTERRLEDIDIVVTNKVVIDKEIIDNSDKLKLICVAATGMNNIDLEYAKEKGIIVKNVAGYSTPSVVQLTFSMLFYLMGHLKYYDNYVKDKKWAESDIFTHLDRPFFELKEKKWGVIGLGTIGLEVANIAKAFGCEVHYYSTSGANNNSNFKRVELNELLAESDIISIHSPLNADTKNLINYENLRLLRDNTILLNLGRGGIINELDLANAIDSKNIFVGLDVLEHEPIKEYHPLNMVENSDRLFITPHIAWASYEARVRLVEAIIKNIKEFLNDK